jgi:glycerate kinase
MNSSLRRAHSVLGVAQGFKGTLNAVDVASALRRGITRAGATATVTVASDGGDGLLAALDPHAVRRTGHRVSDPLGRPVEAHALWLDDRTAVVESREACGLSLLQIRERDPERTSTAGVGELITAIETRGATRAYVGLGGSATVDGGVGMAGAWGWRALDAGGREVPPGGAALERLATLVPGSSPALEIVALCDVRHPLLGEDGAVVFAPQKGASAGAVAALGRGLARLAAVTGEDGPGGLAWRAGSGAAGGLGFGLVRFGGARLVEGAAWVLDVVGFDALLERADLVVVAEAGFDRTSLGGKLSGEVLRRAAARGRPTLLVAPRASDVPPGVLLESDGGDWSAADLETHAAAGVGRALRLLGS